MIIPRILQSNCPFMTPITPKIREIGTKMIERKKMLNKPMIKDAIPMDDDDRGVPDYEIDFKTGSVAIITPYGRWTDKFLPSMKTNQNEALQEDISKSVETINDILTRYEIPTRMQ